MAVLSWKTVNRNDNANLIKTLIANNQLVSEGIEGLGTKADQYVTDKTDKDTGEFIAQLMTADNTAQRDAMIQGAQGQDYLDFEKIGQKSYDLGADERTLATQLAKETRDAESEQLIDQREFDQSKQLKQFDNSLQRSLNAQAFSDNLAIENVKKINADNLAETEYGYDVKVAEKNAELTEQKLDAAFNRSQEELKNKAKIAEEKALASAKSQAEQLKIKDDIAAQLAIDLDLQEKAHKENVQRQKDLTKGNENYLKELGSIPKGLQGIFTKASGGLINATGNDVGATQADIAAYANFRTKTLKSLGYKPQDVRNRDMFDRWAADNIIFNDNSLFGGLNDFSFTNSNGKTNNFGKGGQTLIGDTISEARRAFLDSRVEIDLKNELFSWYEKAEDKGGSSNLRSYDTHWGAYANSRAEGEALTAQGFKAYMAELFKATQ